MRRSTVSPGASLTQSVRSPDTVAAVVSTPSWLLRFPESTVGPGVSREFPARYIVASTFLASIGSRFSARLPRRREVGRSGQDVCGPREGAQRTRARQMTIRFHIFPRCSLSILAAVLMAAVLSSPLTSHAQEQRCTDLGANCICSEPMNTSSLTVPPGSADFGIGFADGGTRKCKYLGIPNTVGEIPASSRSQYFMSNTASTINALTNTGNPAFVFSGREGNTGALILGHSDLPSWNQTRVAMRWYRYYSPNFE